MVYLVASTSVVAVYPYWWQLYAALGDLPKTFLKAVL